MKPVKLKEHLFSLHPQYPQIVWTKKTRFEKAGTLPKLGFLPP